MAMMYITFRLLVIALTLDACDGLYALILNSIRMLQHRLSDADVGGSPSDSLFD